MTVVRQQRHRGRSVVRVIGPLRAGVETELCRTVRSLLRGGRRSIVLDLRGVSDLDAAGLGQLVQIYRMITAAHGEMQVSDPAERVRRIIELAGLLGFLSAGAPTAAPTGASARLRAASPAACP